MNTASASRRLACASCARMGIRRWCKAALTLADKGWQQALQLPLTPAEQLLG